MSHGSGVDVDHQMQLLLGGRTLDECLYVIWRREISGLFFGRVDFVWIFVFRQRGCKMKTADPLECGGLRSGGVISAHIVVLACSRAAQGF